MSEGESIKRDKVTDGQTRI